jgi:4a-hydroxytetrahydrobiopterin dehydratase
MKDTGVYEMPELKNEECEACRIGAPTLSAAEIQNLSRQVPEWQVVEVKGEKQLHRRFRFADFAGALAFTNRVGGIAEASGHHPAILTEWGSVEVRWWTHKIKGLHRNDFVMAAKTDALSR